MSETLQQLFPDAKITRHGDHEEIHYLVPYIWGYSGPNREMTIVGVLTAQQLRALADWMDGQKSGLTDEQITKAAHKIWHET